MISGITECRWSVDWAISWLTSTCFLFLLSCPSFCFCSQLRIRRDSSRSRVHVFLCAPTFMSLSVCVCSASWSQIPGEAFVDFTSLRLLVWVFSGGGVWVSISPGSLRQLRGSVSGCGRRLRGSLFQLSACYCATICGEWKGARPQLGYSSKGDSWDKVRGEMCKCASMCERGVRMTTHRHTPLVLPSVRKWDARLWESRARHFSFYVWWGERSEEETVNGVIVTPAAFPRLFRVSE